MHKEKFVFAQLVSFLNDYKFRHIVDNHGGNKYVKNFTCWNQLLVLMFGQLSGRESLRDVIVTIEAHWRKAYHLGFGKSGKDYPEQLRRVEYYDEGQDRYKELDGFQEPTLFDV